MDAENGIPDAGAVENYFYVGVKFEQSALTITEGGSAFFNVTISSEPLPMFSAQYSAVSWSATEGYDFNTFEGTLEWTPSDALFKTLQITLPNPDKTYKPNRSFNITLDSKYGEVLNTLVVTIIDDDPGISFLQ